MTLALMRQGHNSLLFSDALERFTVLLDIHELASCGIALHPLVRYRIVGLASVLHRADSLVIAIRFVLCHFRSPPSLKHHRKLMSISV